MWEMKSEGKRRQFNAIYAHNKTCKLCGQHFRTGEMFYIIIIPNNLRNFSEKLKENFFVHVDEWDNFCAGITSDIDLAHKLMTQQVRHQKKMTDEEIKKTEAFKSACVSFGFYKEVKKTYGARMRKRGTSIYVDYNAYIDKINIDYKGQKGLFDSLYSREIVAKIYTKMHEILGDGKTDNYKSEEALKKVFDDVNETMKNIF